MRKGSNIRQRTDGRFEARYPKGRDESGRIIYGCCYGKTYEEAQKKREALLKRPVREMNLLILGAGGHGEVVRDIAAAMGVFRKIAFLDDMPEHPLAMGPCRDLENYVEEYPIAIASVGERETRMRWLDELAQAGFVLPVLIHPSAVVSPNAVLEYGTVVEAKAIVGPGAEIGKGCIIAGGATVDRNVRLPDGTHVDCGRVVSASIEE